MAEDLLETEEEIAFALSPVEGFLEEYQEQTIGISSDFYENVTESLSNYDLPSLASAFTQYGTAISAITPRVLVGTVSETLQNEIPRKLNNSVLTRYQASKATLDFLEQAIFTINGIDDDTLLEFLGQAIATGVYRVFKSSKLVWALLQVTTPEQLIGIIRSKLKDKWVLALVVGLIRLNMSLSLAYLMPLSVIYWIKFEGLPQDSKRVWGGRRKQHRVNRVKGPDAGKSN